MVRKNINKRLVGWTADKKGDYTTRQVIKPVTKKIKSLMTKYYKKYCRLDGRKKYDLDEMDRIMKDGLTIMEVMTKIDDEKVNKQILKYMSPFFHAERVKMEKKLEKVNKSSKKVNKSSKKKKHR